ncbi:hypothetical protein BDV09DRAFT_171189 [Aspergillus tetrazonus]
MDLSASTITIYYELSRDISDLATESSAAGAFSVHIRSRSRYLLLCFPPWSAKSVIRRHDHGSTFMRFRSFIPVDFWTVQWTHNLNISFQLPGKWETISTSGCGRIVDQRLSLGIAVDTSGEIPYAFASRGSCRLDLQGQSPTTQHQAPSVDGDRVSSASWSWSRR